MKCYGDNSFFDLNAAFAGVKFVIVTPKVSAFV